MSVNFQPRKQLKHHYRLKDNCLNLSRLFNQFFLIMAKSRSFFGLRSGSTKSHTYQIYRGKQVTKDRVAEVRNPQTAKQTAHRLVFATVSQATKFLAPIVDHSFEGKAFGGVSKNYFQSINGKYLKKLAAIDFADASSAVDCYTFMSTRNISALIPNRYIISDGSLAKAKFTLGVAANNKVTAYTTNSHVNMHEESGGTAGVLGITYREFISAWLGLSSDDDQLTLVTINRTGAESYRYAYQGEATTPGWQIPYTAMNARRVVIEGVNLDTFVALTNDQGEVLEGAADIVLDILGQVFSSPKSDQAFKDLLDSMAGTAINDVVAPEEEGDVGYVDIVAASKAIDFYYIDEDGNGYVYAAGVIRSRRNKGNWLRSRSTMVVARPTGDLLTNFGLDWNSAQLAWFETEQIAENGEFLDEGGDGGQIGENFTPAE